jgi:hypothetical protein
MMKKILRDPLVHFLLGGLLLFIVLDALGPADNIEGSRTVIVDERSLLNFVQYRTRNFDEETARRRVEGLSTRERDALVADFVREEALHREAIALGLDREDYIIKRRLVQKVEYIARGIADSATPPDQPAIAAFYADNKQDYEIAPSVTFTHVYFPDGANAGDTARTKLKDLNDANVPFTQASQHGSLFAYHLNYVDRTPDFIASHFGQPMAEALLAMTPDDHTWQGPLQSDHGYHLVMMTSNKPARVPELAEIQSQILRDLNQQRATETTETAIKAIVDAYEATIDLPDSFVTETPQP